MPFFPVEPEVLPRMPSGIEPPTPRTPSIPETVTAAFLSDNPTVNLARRLFQERYPADPTYGLLQDPEFIGSKYEQDHKDSFVASQSSEESRSIMRRIDAEDDVNRTLDAAGWPGTVARIGAGAFDPTIALPAGAIVRSAKGGYSALRSALSVAAAGAVQTTAQEAALQASQETRTAGESAMAIGSATILSGLIGAGASALLSRAERQVLEKSLDKARADMDAHASGVPVERVVGSAVKVGDKVYTGAIHVDALENAAKDLGISLDELIDRFPRSGTDVAKSFPDKQFSVDGFVTSTGRFVGRAEASTIQEAVTGKTATGGMLTGEELRKSQSMPASAGAAATDTRHLEMLPSIPGTRRMSPTRDILESSSVVARRHLADTAETPYSYRQSEQGIAATRDGPPIDRAVKMTVEGLAYQRTAEWERLWVEHRFGEDIPKFPRVRAGITDTFGNREPGKLSWDEFKQQVSHAMQHGDQHEIPQVAQAAQFARNQMKEWEERAEKVIPDFKPAQQAEGESYFPHIWNRQKHKEMEPEAVNRFVDLYKKDQTTKAGIKERIGALNDELQAKGEALKKAASEDEAIAARAAHDDLRDKIEVEIAAWEGKSVSEAKAAIKAREKYRAQAEAAGGTPGEKGRLTGADDAIDTAVKRIMASEKDLTDEELRHIAQQTVQRIQGSPDGRLPYELHSTGGPRVGYHEGPPPRGPLAGRQLNVSNEWARDWIEDDAEHVIRSWFRTVVPDVLLAEKHGDPEMSMAFREIKDDYSRMMDTTKPGSKERNKLVAERDRVIEKMAGVRDRIRGTYGWAPGMGNLGRIVTGIKQANNLTSMGMSAIASISDFAGAPILHGLTNTFRDGWLPFFNHISRQDEIGKEFRHQWRSAGIGVDTATNMRQHTFDDIVDGFRPTSKVERALQWTNDKFFVANGLAPLTDIQKFIEANVSSGDLLRSVKAIVEGRATKRQITDLANGGINAEMAARIHRQFFELGHGKTVDNVHLPNTDDWTDKAAARAFIGKVSRDVDIGVITPGQDKPLLMSSQIGSLLGQFKSFTAAANERILIANLQKRDARALSGILFSVGLGMLSYKINSVLGGQKTSDRPQDWIKEGWNRSGMGGWMEEGNAMAAKTSGGSVDVWRLIGADKPLSKFAARGIADAFLGPTAGKLAQIGKIGHAAGTGTWSEGDTEAVKRLIFFQNLPYVRGLFNKVAEGTNRALGIESRH